MYTSKRGCLLGHFTQIRKAQAVEVGFQHLDRRHSVFIVRYDEPGVGEAPRGLAVVRSCVGTCAGGVSDAEVVVRNEPVTVVICLL